MKMAFWYPHIFWYKETEIEQVPEIWREDVITELKRRGTWRGEQE